MADFSNVNVGFSVGDLLSGSSDFIVLFVGFIIAVLSIKMAPSILHFLDEVISNARVRRGWGQGAAQSLFGSAKDSIVFTAKYRGRHRRR